MAAAERSNVPDGPFTVKLPRHVHSTLRTLQERICERGWSSLKVDRTGQPTMAAVVEAALDLLAAQGGDR